MMSARFRLLLNGYEAEVINRTFHSLALFSFCYYNKSQNIPTFEYLKSFKQGLFDLGDDDNKNVNEDIWRAFLRNYEFYFVDEFDLEIARAIEHGYVDDDTFIDQARIKNEESISSKSTESFSNVWRRAYHGTFEENEEDLVDELYNSFKLNAKYISLNNVDSTVQLFRELGKDNLADEIIEIYINVKKVENYTFSSKKLSIFGPLKDRSLVARYKEEEKSFKTTMSLREVLEKLSDQDGWSQEDVNVLAGTSPEEFYDFFKSQKGSQLPLYIDTCLKFGNFGSTSDQHKNIANNATIALQKIGEESTLNSLRVATYGVKTGSGASNPSDDGLTD